MKNKNYTKVQLGELLLIIPGNKYLTSLRTSLKNILWSHKSVDYKVFGEFSVEFFINIFLRKNPHFQKKVKILDLRKPDIYPKEFENILLNSNSAKAVSLGYKYFLEIEKKMSEDIFMVEIGWDSNTRDKISFIGLDEFFNKKEDTEIGIMYSSYSDNKIETLEKIVCSMLECKLNNNNYPFSVDDKISIENFLPKPFFKKDIYFEKGFCGYLFHEDKLYTSLLGVNSYVYAQISLLDYFYLFSSINSFYNIRIGIEDKINYLFKHSIYLDYGLAENNIYSLHTQIVNIFRGEFWKFFQKKHSKIDKLIFDINLFSRGKMNRKHLIIFEAFDKNWNLIWRKKIPLRYELKNNFIINLKQIKNRVLN